jgi:NADH:ubiquinone oxidoreductase subunit 3 (subunit A)
MDGELTTFYPVFVFGVIVLGMVVGMVVTSHLIAPKKHTPVKDMPYESGMDPVGDARQHFDVRYYLVAILFLVFDVELLFLYPWAVAAYQADGGLRAEGREGLWGPVFGVMVFFLATLAVGYVYAWRKGVFKWR